jgi:hypothetical protein
MRHPTLGTRRLKRGLGFGLLMVLVVMLAPGVRSVSYAGELYFSPPCATTFALIEQENPPSLHVYHIPLRVHLNRSARRSSAFSEILKEINHIWWSQAGICFEIQVVMNDYVQSTGFDLWFVPRINNNDAMNGIFGSGHSIYVRDTPILNAAPKPAQHPAARTAAHELGHALSLPHRQDSDDNLMRSKTYGWQLNQEEVAIARKAAAAWAIKNNISSTCSQVRINP